MGKENEVMKTIKVSKEVHEELSNRKYGGETFDDVLKRELELIPTTIQELTAVLPEKLATATQLIIKDHINSESSYKRIGRRDDNKLSLKYIEQNSNKVIFEVSVYLPAPPDRINHRVDIRYRTPQNELERIAQLRDTKDNAVNISEIKSFDTHKVTENTRKGEDAGQAVANDVVGPEVAQFVEQSHNVWGDEEE